MKKKILILLFSVHLLLIFFQAFWTTVDMYFDIHYNKKIDIPILNVFRQNNFTEPYYLISGINTGYGFYGIKTATEKYLRCTCYDSSDKILNQDRYFNLKTSNGISRLESLNANQLKALNYRKDYINKLFKWQGKEFAKSIPGCTSYKIELITIVPKNTEEQKLRTKPELYVIQENFFYLQ
ncbi:hypothetical protein [Psychroflexus lacisalsi]|nr:hypothetical protein [Psychroflexus lacisalsi]MBZ9620720.1 hypothetical protein [Psychroflexus lacisalsi]